MASSVLESMVPRLPVAVRAVSVVALLAVVVGCGGGGGGGGAAVNQQLADQGKQLASQYGCIACHTVDGKQSVGPTWKGLYGAQIKLADGQAVTADEAYLRESITNTDAKIHQGFQPGTMGPAVEPFMAQIKQGQNLDALVEYIKSVK